MALTTQQNPWGMNAPIDYSMPLEGQLEAAGPDRFVNINGQRYYQLGPTSQIVPGTNPQADFMLANAIDDPTYGKVVPQAIYDQANQQHIAQNVKSDFMDNAPLAAMVAAGGLAGYSALGGAAGAGGAGAFDAAGVGALGSADAAAAGLGGITAPTAGAAGAAGASTALDMGGATGAFDMGGVGAAGSADAVASGLVPGLGQTGAAAGTGAAGSTSGLWQRVMNGTATADDWAKIAGNVGSVGLGLYGANQQADALRDINSQQTGLAREFMAMGAPYRDLLSKSYDPSFDLFAQPGYADAFNKTADLSTRSWSGRGVNPSNNPGAQTEIQRDVFAGAYLPALAQYRGGLGQFGGLGLNTSGSLFSGSLAPQMAATGADRSMYSTLAGGLGELTKPSNPYDDYINKLRLSIGGMPA